MGGDVSEWHLGVTDSPKQGIKRLNAGEAQMVVRLVVCEIVAGSSPVTGANLVR